MKAGRHTDGNSLKIIDNIAAGDYLNDSLDRTFPCKIINNGSSPAETRVKIPRLYSLSLFLFLSLSYSFSLSLSLSLSPLPSPFDSDNPPYIS